MHPKISLIIPVYNVEKYLEKCLDSAINQTFEEIEIIITNDGSTDNSLNILEEFSKKDNRIKVFSQPNKGLGFTRNIGIQNACGEYVFFMDSDDWIEVDALDKLYKKAQTEKSDVVIGGWKRIEEKSGKTLNTRRDINACENSSKEIILKQVLSGKMNLMTWGCLIDRNIFDKNHIIYPNVFHEDLYVMPKIYFYAKKISIEKDYLYNWLVRKNSITANINIKHAVGICGAINDLKIFLHKEKVFKKYQYQFVQFTFAYIHTLLKKTNTYAADDDKIKIHKLVSETFLNIPELESYEKALSISDKKAYIEAIIFYVTLLNSTKKDFISRDNNSFLTENIILKIEKEYFLDKPEKQLARQQETIHNREETIKGKEYLVSKLEKQVAGQQETIHNREKTIKEKEALIERQKNTLSNIKKIMQSMIKFNIFKRPMKKYKAYKKLIKEIKNVT